MPKTPNKDLWRPDKIQVFMEDDKGKKVDPYLVDGKRLGLLAIHPHRKEPTTFDLRALACGYWLGAYTRESDAMLIGEELWAKARLAISNPDVNKVRAQIPEWIKNWLIQCRLQKAYLNPTPFETGRGV